MFIFIIRNRVVRSYKYTYSTFLQFSCNFLNFVEPSSSFSLFLLTKKIWTWAYRKADIFWGGELESSPVIAAKKLIKNCDSRKFIYFNKDKRILKEKYKKKTIGKFFLIRSRLAHSFFMTFNARWMNNYLEFE